MQSKYKTGPRTSLWYSCIDCKRYGCFRTLNIPSKDLIFDSRSSCHTLLNSSLTSKNAAGQYCFVSRVGLIILIIQWYYYSVECCWQNPNWSSRIIFDSESISCWSSFSKSFQAVVVRKELLAYNIWIFRRFMNHFDCSCF